MYKNIVIFSLFFLLLYSISAQSMNEEDYSQAGASLSRVPQEVLQENVMVKVPAPSLLSLRVSETMMAHYLNDESFLRVRGSSLFDICFDDVPSGYAKAYSVNPNALDVFGIDSSASSYPAILCSVAYLSVACDLSICLGLSVERGEYEPCRVSGPSGRNPFKCRKIGL